jgi:hypothetical protein
MVLLMVLLNELILVILPMNAGCKISGPACQGGFVKCLTQKTINQKEAE